MATELESLTAELLVDAEGDCGATGVENEEPAWLEVVWAIAPVAMAVAKASDKTRSLIGPS